jgi:cytochrome c biogenesis protein CcmG/thiol:disulfide interchange protein DsbE
MWRYIFPLAGFILILVVLAVGLTLNPAEVPSPLVGKSAPEFTLPRLHEPSQTLSLQDLKGHVTLLNVWASWCESCRVEHPLLLNIAASGAVPVYGLNYKDEREKAIGWLKKLGDPYQAIAVDQNGRTAIDFGVYGAPETYLIDQNGIIVYKKIGPVTPQDWQKNISPLIQQLRAEKS